MNNNDDSTTPARQIDLSAQTVELDARVLRKLVVSTILDLGEDSGSVPANPPPSAAGAQAEPAAVVAAVDDDKRV